MSTRTRWLWPFAVALLLVGGGEARGAGVTVITHGFNGNVDDWVIPMGDKLAQYPTFPGSNCASYQVSITRNGSVYNVSQAFLDGVSPTASDSGEIIIALDWSTLSGGTVPTTAIATQAITALLTTNFIPDLNGRPLAELPLHFVGHSRGASVITEMARLLGAQGLWVDHVTTLDPYPVSLFSDPAMKNYANILFADNYWQTLGAPSGQSIPGAYNRQLTNLNGGYGSSHSDTHLWYHGTIDWHTPISVDMAMITSTERSAWWTTAEAAGTNTGILYSLIGQGNRFSTNQPAGTGHIIDGYNKIWDLGAGLAANPATNRTLLPFDNGAWPNLLRLNLTGATNITLGDPIPVAFYYQFASSTSAVANLQFYLDPDSNPYNTNETQVLEGAISGTGTNSVRYSSLNLSPNPLTTAPGTYAVFARITAGSRTRYLYAPRKVILGASSQPPVLGTAQVQSNQFRCLVSALPGQTIIVQGSEDFTHWVPLRTNLMTGPSWLFADPDTATSPQRYYRAVLP